MPSRADSYAYTENPENVFVESAFSKFRNLMQLIFVKRA